MYGARNIDAINEHTISASEKHFDSDYYHRRQSFQSKRPDRNSE
jgi:hypothetical protein